MTITNLLPILVPLIGFLGCLLAKEHSLYQRIVSIICAICYLVIGIGLTRFDVGLDGSSNLGFGAWPEPFSIRFAFNPLANLLILVTGISYLSTTLYADIGTERKESSFELALIHLVVSGVSGSFMTQDLFNMYVFFEITLIASFVSTILSEKKNRLKGAMIYIVLNLLSSFLFLLGAGLTYIYLKTLDLEQIPKVAEFLYATHPKTVLGINALLFCAFAIKAALFPFYSWLPASYHRLSPRLSGFYAGLLTKLGLFAIFRVCFISFHVTAHHFYYLIICLAALSMLFGVFGAIVQTHIRRILSFHVISQVGYLLCGAYFLMHDDTRIQLAGLTSVVFYMIHHIVVKTNLFFSAGIILESTGTERLGKLGGLRLKLPIVAIVFAVPALSLAGLPPSSGFWAKFGLIRSTLDARNYFLVVTMLAAGFLTVFSMSKIWLNAFWLKPPEDIKFANPSKISLLSAGLLSIFSLGIAFFPDLLFKESLKVANWLQAQILAGKL